MEGESPPNIIIMTNLDIEFYLIEKLRNNRYQLVDPKGNVVMIRNANRISEIYKYLNSQGYNYQEEF